VNNCIHVANNNIYIYIILFLSKLLIKYVVYLSEKAIEICSHENDDFDGLGVCNERVACMN
jgi:hypothetical protein